MSAHILAGSPRVIVAEGTDAEIGAGIGELTSSLISRNVEAYMRRFRDEARLERHDVMRRGGEYVEIGRKYDPSAVAVFAGMAEASGLPLEIIAALNARTELLYGGGDEGCTSVAIQATHTTNGHTLLAQNWDWRTEQGELTFLLATRDPEGFSALTLTEAGMLAKSGLNSSGVGMCANLLVSDRDRGGKGVPYHFLLRGALHQPRLSSAIKKVTDTIRISSGNIMLAAAGGEAIDLELVPGDFGSLLPTDGVVTHSNHFLSDVPVRDEFAATSALTLVRHDRLRRLIGASERLVCDRTLAEGLRDHFSFPDSVCRHSDPLLPRREQVSSLYSVLMDMEDRTLSIAPENACGHPYERWSLDTVFMPDARPEVVLQPVEEDHR